jgi:hypothetical protein
MQTFVLKQSTEVVAAAKAELKVSLILLYYLTVGVVGLIGVTYIMNNQQQVQDDITDFLICSAQGGSFTNCQMFITGILSAVNTLTDISLILVAFLPVALLIFSINFKLCRMMLQRSTPRKES